METNWKELAEKYQIESEIYSLAYDDVLKPLRAISVMQGVIVQMMSEQVSYEIKNGKNERSASSGDRLKILLDGLMNLNGLAEKNIRSQQLLKGQTIKLIEAQNEIENLKKQLAWVK